MPTFFSAKMRCPTHCPAIFAQCPKRAAQSHNFLGSVWAGLVKSAIKTIAYIFAQRLPAHLKVTTAQNPLPSAFVKARGLGNPGKIIGNKSPHGGQNAAHHGGP